VFAPARYDPRSASTHFNLGEALLKKGNEGPPRNTEAADLDKRNPVYRAAYALSGQAEEVT
jgi:hypothetical protein